MFMKKATSLLILGLTVLMAAAGMATLATKTVLADNGDVSAQQWHGGRNFDDFRFRHRDNFFFPHQRFFFHHQRFFSPHQRFFFHRPGFFHRY